LRAGKIYQDVLWRTVEVNEGGKKKRMPRVEYVIRRLAKRAANGDIKSAELLMYIHHRSKRSGDYRHEPIAIREWEKPGNLKVLPGMSAVEASAIVNRLLQETHDSWPD
jgi:hypothetical protein